MCYVLHVCYVCMYVCVWYVLCVCVVWYVCDVCVVLDVCGVSECLFLLVPCLEYEPHLLPLLSCLLHSLFDYSDEASCHVRRPDITQPRTASGQQPVRNQSPPSKRAESTT